MILHIPHTQTESSAHSRAAPLCSSSHNDIYGSTSYSINCIFNYARAICKPLFTHSSGADDSDVLVYQVKPNAHAERFRHGTGNVLLSLQIVKMVTLAHIELLILIHPFWKRSPLRYQLLFMNGNAEASSLRNDPIPRAAEPGVPHYIVVSELTDPLRTTALYTQYYRT